MFNKNPEWVVYHEVVNTSKEYMRNVSTINPKWLMDVAGKYFKVCDPNVLTKKQRNEKIEPLAVRFGDPNEWRLSKRKGFLWFLFFILFIENIILLLYIHIRLF